MHGIVDRGVLFILLVNRFLCGEWSSSRGQEPQKNTRAPLPYHDLGSQRGFVQREPTPRHLAEWETAWHYALRGGGSTCCNVGNNVGVGAARASARTVRNVGGKVALHNALHKLTFFAKLATAFYSLGCKGVD